MKKFRDEYGNTATIKERMIIPFRGSHAIEKAFVLSLSADYDHDFIYHVSVHETEENAMVKLKTMSCDTWKCIQ